MSGDNGVGSERFLAVNTQAWLQMHDAQVSVEDCLIAVSVVVSGANIRSASHMNKANVFFLTGIQMMDDLIETGLIIKDSFVPVLPLSSPSKKVVLSNVPPFVKNEKLEQILQRYGKIVSPIKIIPLGCKNPDIKHVMSFRRQAFMIFNSSDPLNLSAKLSIDGKDYTIFISSDSMRCFVCGDFGHIRQLARIETGQQAFLRLRLQMRRTARRQPARMLLRPLGYQNPRRARLFRRWVTCPRYRRWLPLKTAWWRLLRRWPGRVIFPLYRRQRRARNRCACSLCLGPIRFVLKNKSSLTN